MKFSVLISVYNKEKHYYFREAINSIITQTIVPDEIVIVKDGKLTEELDSVIEEFTRIYDKIFRIIELEKKVGLGEALRIGLLNCSYEIVARMDSDDISLPNRFETQLKAIKENSAIDVVGTWIGEFTEDAANISTIRKLPLNSHQIIDYAKRRNPLNHMTVMFKKNSVLSTGNYEGLNGFEDYFLWCRMILKNYKLINLPEVLVLARIKKDLPSWRGGLRYLKNEMIFERKILEMKFINYREFLINIISRGFVRIIPNKLRLLIYKLLLREKYRKRSEKSYEENFVSH